MLNTVKGDDKTEHGHDHRKDLPRYSDHNSLPAGKSVLHNPGTASVAMALTLFSLVVWRCDNTRRQSVWLRVK